VRGILFTTALAFLGFAAWSSSGLWPAPYPSPYALPAGAIVAAVLGVALWALCVRDAFRRTRG
jgi:hypothetical protein